MPEINFNTLENAATEIMTHHQAAIHKHGVKEIAGEVKKSTPTVYAELSPENLVKYLSSIKDYDDNKKNRAAYPSSVWSTS